MRHLLILLLLALAAAPVGAAESGTASITEDLPARTWKGVRLKNIPMGSKLRVEVETDGPVIVALLTAQEYGRFPESERAVFRAEAQDALSFSVLAPERGDYYLLIDNRTGDAARSVELTIEAHAPSADRAGEK